MARLRPGAGLAAALLLYLALALPHLSRPVLHGDEASTVLPSLSLLGYPQPKFVRSLAAGPLELPLAFFSRHGALESYLAAPFIAGLGHTPEAIRLCAISLGTLTLCALFLLCREFFRDLRVASIAALLAAGDSFYVYASYSGMHYAIALVLFQLAAMWLFTRWLRSGRERDFHLGALSLGASMACRSWAVFGIAGMICATAAVKGRSWWRASRSGWAGAGRRLAFGALFFLLGALPLTLFVALDRGGDAPFNVDNSRYAENIMTRLSQVGDMASLHSGPAGLRLLRWSLLLLGPLWLLGSCWSCRGRFSPAQKAFFPLCLLGMLLASPFTISQLRPAHLFLMAPILKVIAAAALVDFWDRSGAGLSERARGGLLAASLLLAFYAHLPRARDPWAPERQSASSDVIGELAGWLAANGLRAPRCPDVNLYPLLAYRSGSAIQARFVSDLSDPRGPYFMHEQLEGGRFHREFLSEARRRGYQAVLFRRFGAEDDPTRIAAYSLGRLTRP